MIISKKKNFVFLHCRKTAGTYISSCLYNILAKDDFIIGSLKEIYENKQLKFSNHLDILYLKNFKFLKNSILKNKSLFKFGNILNDFYKEKYVKYFINPPHMRLETISKVFPFSKNFFKFCFVRNPYDYAVSDYLWRIRKNQISFNEYLRLKINNDQNNFIAMPITNWEIYTINDKIEVDYVGKFENLNSDLKKIFGILKINENYLENNFFLKKNNQRTDYKDYYDEECKKLVSKLHYKEIDQFKYTF